jgi:hypothetical protein
MPPHDTEHDALSPIPPESARRAGLPDDTSHTEHGAVSTEFDAGTGRRVKTGVVIAAGFRGPGSRASRPDGGMV